VKKAHERRRPPVAKPVRPQLNISSSVRELRANSGSAARGMYNRIFAAQSQNFYRLLAFTFFLLVFGLVMVFSASSIDSLKDTNNSLTIGGRQLLFGAIGLVALAAASMLSIQTIKRFAKFAFVITMGMQLLVLVIGKSVGGNRNWIQIPGVGAIQPSEFLKIGLILMLSLWMAKRQDRLYDGRVWWQALLIAVAAMGCVLLGSDLGTVIVMFASVMMLLNLAGMPNRINLTVIAAVIISVPMLLTVGSGSRVGRIMAWLNPSAPDPNDYNWQPIHGEYAIAAGGIFGSGLGESKMKWSWIPVVENDFIFAVIGEELGLIGAAVLIGLFVFLAISFRRIFENTRDDFARFVVGGVMSWIVLQALINIAVVLRLLPVLGVPLPLISQGGSSLVATLGAIGLVLAIERDNHQNFSNFRQPRRVR